MQSLRKPIRGHRCEHHFATFIFLSFHLNFHYLKYSDSVVSENALPENGVLIYSKVFYTS